MKRLMILATSTLAALTSGCASSEPISEARGPLNAWLTNSIRGNAVDRAIIAQYTLLPYHFEAGGAELNELGWHDLEVLAVHYRAHPGQLNIRRGDASDDLYQARVSMVVGTLAKRNVDTEQMPIADAPLGGEGMASERVLIILQGDAEPGSAGASGGSSDSLGGIGAAG